MVHGPWIYMLARVHLIARYSDWNRNQRSKWRFTCDSNENGVADENESFLTEWIKNGDFSKIVVNCGDLDNCLGCLDSEIK